MADEEIQRTNQTAILRVGDQEIEIKPMTWDKLESVWPKVIELDNVVNHPGEVEGPDDISANERLAKHIRYVNASIEIVAIAAGMKPETIKSLMLLEQTVGLLGTMDKLLRISGLRQDRPSETQPGEEKPANA